jgi:hypothetical protein
MLLVRMRLPRLVAILLAFFSAHCAARTAARYTVTGMVVNSATDEPIRRALVAVGASLVLTGADGRFQAENVPEGQTMVSAQKPGYFECATPGCGPNGSPARITIKVQSGTNDVLLKLLPEAKIEGRVVDEDGEPIGDVQVQILGEHIFNGQKQLRPDGGGATDENGTYRIENLLPGTYSIRTLPRPAFWSDAGTESTAQVYAQRFFPNTPDAASAQQMDLKPGQVAVADFTLISTSAFRIVGSIAPTVPSLSLNVQDSDGIQINSPIQFDPKSGKFLLSFVPAGTWTLEFTCNEPEGHSLYASQTLTVNSQDVKGLRIALQPLPSLPVNIVNGPAEVQLVSRDPRWRGGIFGDAGPRAPEGPHVISVPPGDYRVFVPASAGRCVDSLTSGNIDLTREDLTVAPGSQPQAISLTLRNDCATLQVTVRSPNQAAQPTVVLIPASHALQPVTTALDPSGSYVFTDLSPGEYQVYAFSSIDGLEYANPEAMREFPGQQITLSPNQRANIPLDVIVREAN